jgi:archaellum component FlaF (FlaF/FlaG flagellin family)
MTACGNVITNGINGKNLKGNGVFKEKERGKMDFNAINTRGSIDVIIADVADAPIKVSGDENLIDSIETYVKDGVLNVHFKSGYGYSSKSGLKVTVPNNGRINKIMASGSSDVITEGCIVSDNMSISCKGSSDFKGNIKAEKCELNFNGSSDFKGSVEAVTCNVKCSGSSDCIINGKADICDISMAGSSDFKGYDFIVAKLNCNTSGSSDIQVTCNEELSVKASGSSDVHYKGTATVTNKHLSGSSDLVHK